MSSRTLTEIREQYDVALRLTQGGADLIASLRAELAQVQRLVLMGTGASLLACRAAQYGFVQYSGRLPHVLPAAEVDWLVQVSGPETLVLLVSQSGQSYETQLAIQALTAAGIRFWGVTNNPDSALARQAERVLAMDAGEEVSSATKTYTATLLLLFRLAGADRLEHISEDVRRTLAAAEPAVAGWAAALQDAAALYVLGMGWLGATAAQGALLLKEKTAIPSEGLSLSEFRHGHIEVVRPGLPLLVLAATAPAAGAALQHAEYFAGLGAAVYLISDAPLRSDRIPPEQILQVCNSGDGITAQIPAVIPLQLLAERIARGRGRDVDGFRYIAKTVDRYAL